MRDLIFSRDGRVKRKNFDKQLPILVYGKERPDLKTCNPARED